MSEDAKNIRLTNVRLFFPVLFTPKSFKDDPNGRKQFSAKFGIRKDDAAQIQAVKAGILAAATEKWPGKQDEILRRLAAENRLCMFDGDNKDTQGYEGTIVVSGNNSTRPLSLSRSKAPLTEADGVLYSGCFVNALLSFWAQDNSWGKRVNCNLRGVQFYADGEAFSGGGTASVDEFEEHKDDSQKALDSFGF